LSRKELHVLDGYVESVYDTNVAYKVLLARDNTIGEGKVISTNTAFILHTVFSRCVLYFFALLR
jgi:DNA-directed RNA polymerase subunit E'/Rpb7|tara:strand:+ start:597 stop:788 length:192 start_codon:yes stop_codon:yes gene_type:complete